MNVAQKIDYAEAHIRSIAAHHDTDAAVRKAALDQVAAYITDQKAEIDAEVAAEIAALGG